MPNDARITVEISSSGGGAVAGVVRLAGRELPFSGWLELMALIERLTPNGDRMAGNEEP